MNSWSKKLHDSPALVRALPFVIFVSLTMLQGQFGEASRYWIYLGKSVIGIGLICVMYPFVKEMRWAFSWEAVVVGIAVCVMWIGIDGWYPSLDQIIQNYFCPILKKIGLANLCPKPVIQMPWNPHAQFGQGTTLAWVCIVGRILASSIVVPPLEEVFYRSFLYRYIIKSDFTAVSFGAFHAIAFVFTAIVFGFSHYEWLAGILCAFAYQGLVIYKKRLGDAMFAHAITNFLLGLWIVWKGDWHFW